MTEKLIAEYLYNYWSRLENERIQHLNNMCYREVDELDYLELIILKIREREYTKISKDIYTIMKM